MVLNYKQSSVHLDKLFFQMDSAVTLIMKNYVPNVVAGKLISFCAILWCQTMTFHKKVQAKGLLEQIFP